ncbi:Panacea domain-containing protein [Microbacterium sp. As-52]|uniref:Panacea domain-containing protein n=1 Tax=Microbacterium sp. As-52 TaxID=3390503 RepID=UPI003CE7A882
MVTADQVASVILARSGRWTDAMKLQKLLYYVQSWHLAITDEPLFSERFKAYRDGPVVPQVRHARADRNTRRADQDLTGIQLDSLSSDIVDLVLASYGSRSGEELSTLTHSEEPWVQARGGLSDDAAGNTPISEATMAAYYRAHRTLGGRTASDLAAGGIHLSGGDAGAPVDVDALLAVLPVDMPVDRWGGANLPNEQA